MPSIEKNLIIRADANTRMGTGHVMRCIALGQAWKDLGGEIVFFTRCDNKVLLQRLRDENFDVVILEREDEFIPCLSSYDQHPADESWLVLDGYQFGAEIQRAVRDVGHRLLLIDDYNHLGKYECDVLVNQNINAPELNYCVKSDAKLLLGSDYVLLRREFRGALPMGERINSDAGKKLLITLGGADPDNATLDVINALKFVGVQDLCARVVIGPANLNLDSLKLAAESSSVNIELVQSVKDMTSLMQWADVAVSAGGSTCWEFCRMGVPFMTLILAENQRALANRLAEQDVAPCLGEHPSPGTIAKVVERLLSNMGERANCKKTGCALVDGFGVDRVMYQISKGNGVDIFTGRLCLRPAVANDSELYWKWANDPVVRDNSYYPSSIPLQIHCKWFSDKLESKDSLMLVLNLDGVPTGQIRYDSYAGIATIGFSIDQHFRGLGLGRRIVEDSLDLAMKSLGVKTVRAEVFEENTASTAAFVKTGFELSETSVIKGVPSHVFIRKLS